MNNLIPPTPPLSPLTVRDLLDILNKQVSVKPNTLDAVIVVKSNEPSIGPTSCTPVISATLGIDWDTGRFIIYPVVNMKRMTKEDEEIMERQKRVDFQKYLKNRGYLDVK